ncbi:imidazole glycerol phosphate synthase subunit HisH [Salisediminibacterium halotolerans]|uniref:Imidazole glycerol phosphate synthase subunit HisH n=1 Tax=Salisediminibacterium halotolerans TaxID=517425 RepID=A0A1H9W113_9BACI|nr:imidazole glycerol phosphate synthase subunit HisH [Salisediminibacterium haloalkalitolerans]SES27528.1 glutamine amidotransferase [Salisediminibacterium haloalkalitolerans]
MIGVVDYGMGNLHSVMKALERLGSEAFLSGDPAELQKADKLILPGVGSFRDGMQELKTRKLDTFLTSWKNDGRPLLGICLGMQLLFEASEERGETAGLAFLPGRVRLFPAGNWKVPHMGWNQLTVSKPDHPAMFGVDGGHVYFVHSYVVELGDAAADVAHTYYAGMTVPAVVAQGDVWGTQFHPEKSSVVGMAILKNFLHHKGGPSRD